MFAKITATAIDRLFIKKPSIRRLVTRLIYGSGLRKVRLFGADITIHSLRENGYLRAWLKARYSSLFRDEISGLLALFQVLRPGDLFVDVGANIGIYSSVVSRLPGVRVLAIEANPDTFARLEANAQTHGFAARCAAVSDQRAVLEFTDGAVSHAFSVSEHKTDYHDHSTTANVEAFPLDELLLEHTAPIVMKIDVEGHEPQVIAGAAGLLDAGRIQAVLIDTSPATASAVNALRARGFRMLDAETFEDTHSHTGALLALEARPARQILPERA